MNLFNHNQIFLFIDTTHFLFIQLERAGAIIPPLPEKQAVSRFSPDFVEDRRRALERFLRRVIIHPELLDAQCLLTFLRADDVSFQHAKSISEKMEASATDMSGSTMMGGAGAFSLSPKNAAGIKKWFSEAKTTFSGELVRSPDDDLFDEIERYIEALSVQMKRVSNQASGLVRKSKEIANGMFEFGLAFHQLGQSEGELLGNKLQMMGQAADTLSAMAATLSQEESTKLEEPLKDYIKIIYAVKLALNRRHDKRVSYTALLSEIQSREVQLHRLRMTPGAEGKAYSTEISLQRYQASAEVAREEYAECSQRVLREVDRFKREKAEEMKLMVLEVIRAEIEWNRKMEVVWAKLVPKLEAESRGFGDDLTAIAASNDGKRNQLVNIGGQIRQQPEVAIMPPSQPPPPVPQPSSMAYSQLMYSNVPATSMAPLGGGSQSPLMESSIQYRDNNLPGMGL